MFFKKEKNFDAQPQNESEINGISLNEMPQNVSPAEEMLQAQEALAAGTEFPYSFYKPEPYPKDLVSVITKMLKKMFPDTRKAFLLEAQQNKKKGYLLIVDIEPKFLKIINIYLDGETKKVRGNVPIECVLYSKTGTITEGIDPFYVKETAQSKANNLASKEFSGEITFSDMPEFELWKNTDKKDVCSAQGELGANDVLAPLNEDTNEAQNVSESNDKENDKTEENITSSEAIEEQIEKTESETEAQAEENTEEKSQTKVKPSNKQELFRLLNEYGAKKTNAVSTIAMAAIKEFVFYIPYSYSKSEFSGEVDNSLPIDESLRFEKLVDPDDEKSAVPLFTEKEDAILFAKNNNCKVVILKYKDFSASRAAEVTAYDGVVINPDSECIFFLKDHPLLAE